MHHSINFQSLPFNKAGVFYIKYDKEPKLLVKSSNFKKLWKKAEKYSKNNKGTFVFATRENIFYLKNCGNEWNYQNFQLKCPGCTVESSLRYFGLGWLY